MTLWLSEVLSPTGLLRALALLLVVAAVAMPTLSLMRWTAVAAGVAGVVTAAVVPEERVELVFWGLLVIVALGHLLAGSRWRLGGRLSPEAEFFRERVVPSLSVGQVKKLLSVARWREVVPGTALTRAGERTGELCFLLRGAVDIVVDGHRVAECGRGTLIGEIGLSTGDPATATAICATPVRYLGFEAAALYRLLDDDSALQDAMELAVERSLREKIQRSNRAAVHGGRPPG